MRIGARVKTLLRPAYIFRRVVSHYGGLSTSAGKLVAQKRGRYGTIFRGSRVSRKSCRDAD